MEIKKPSYYYYKQAKKFLSEAKLNKSLKISREGMLFYPNSKELEILYLTTQIKLGNFAVAKNRIKKLYKKNPQNADVLCALIEIYLSAGRKSKADFYAKKAVNLFKFSSLLVERIALLYANHSHYQDACYYFEKVLKLSPSSAYINLGLGICFERMGNTKKAIRYLKRSIKLKKNFYEPLNYLGNIFYDCGKIKEAIAMFKCIPIARHMDPVTIKRLCKHCKNKTTLNNLNKRLKTLLSNKDIAKFINKLEKKAEKESKDKYYKMSFLTMASINKLTPVQKNYFYDIDRYLTELFASPTKPDISETAKLKSANINYIEKLLSVSNSYLATLTKQQKPFRLWQADKISFYLLAVIKFLYDEKIEYKINQKTIDLLFNNIIILVKKMSPTNRHRVFLMELGSFIIAFWNKEDMLNRIILIREILTQKERKKIEPIILRGRAWRKWLGFKAESAWSYPWFDILGKMPKTYGQGKTVNCFSCRRNIKDFWNITNNYSGKPVNCGDCATFLRCKKCDGPCRHISTWGRQKNEEIQTHKCMQCGKTQKMTVKMVK